MLRAQAKWQKIWSKRFSLRLAENWVYSVRQFRELFGMDFPDQLILIRDGFGTGYLDDDQWRVVSDRIFVRLTQKRFENYFEKEALPVFSEFSAHCKELGAREWTAVGSATLTRALDEFEWHEDHWMNYVWFVFLLDEIVSKRLSETIRANWPARENEIRAMVLSPSKKTAAARYSEDLLELAQSSDLTKDAARLAKRYAFFPILNLDEEPLSVADVLQQVNDTKRQTPDVAHALFVRREQSTVLEHSFNAFLRSVEDRSVRNLLEAAHKIAFYREYRNDLRQENYFHARGLFGAIAQEIKLTIREATFLTRAETRAALTNSDSGLLRAKAHARMKRVGIQSHKNRVEYVLEPTVVEALEKTLGDPNAVARTAFETTGVLTGVAASPGKIEGHVCLIQSPVEDGKRLKDGDVLVATTTNLSFVPLMERAAAVVTDEGGLLTHAAIVARELKKPCVSGTKIATRALKNGDRIEVDGGAGTVRKIKG